MSILGDLLPLPQDSVGRVKQCDLSKDRLRNSKIYCLKFKALDMLNLNLIKPVALRTFSAMKLSRLSEFYAETNRVGLLATAFSLLIAIAIADYFLLPTIPFGAFYILPILLAAGFLSRWQLLFLALVCAMMREVLGPFPMGLVSVPRVLMGFIAFVGAGLFVNELARNRQIALTHIKQIQEETQLRKDVEKELQVLVDSSPAAILILDSQRKVSLSNAAACKMLALEGNCLVGKQIDPYLPVLKNIGEMSQLSEFRHTEMESTGRRHNGEIFRVHLWISTYLTGLGARLAVIAVDISEELRDREESGLDRMLSTSRVLVGAVAHEIRNLCGAIAVAHANLTRFPGLANSEDFRALGNLLEALRNLASAELRPLSRGQLAGVPLGPILDDLRIVMEPTFQEIDATVTWELPAAQPAVWADAQSLLQVFLNLTQNSHRALRLCFSKVLSISCKIEAESVILKFADTGSGVRHPEWLFRPFQHGADASGLGLYVSRAIVRSFGGDLRFEPHHQGACFVVELLRADREVKRPA
jgi:PAS domain S-box-containing protein